MRKAMLLILDGYGLRDEERNNAVKLAKTPNLNNIFKQNNMVTGNASGLFVGLPDGQMGNSEVGHLNIGAGRVVYQSITRISKSIQDGDFFENEELLRAIKNCKEKGSALHLFGLLSDGGVHSHIKHLYGLLKIAKDNGLEKVYIHPFLDGRDTPPNSGIGFVRELLEKTNELKIGKIATIMGRFYAMDRDNIYDRTKIAYDALTKGVGEHFNSSIEALQVAYENGEFDEFVKPKIIEKDGVVKEDDSVVFFNFRPDRARQITRAFVDDKFEGFSREKINTTYVCFTDYDHTIKNKYVAYKPIAHYENTLGEYIAKKGLKQLRITETQKYAHVTFFFNGGEEEANKNEDRILIESPKVATFDEKPEMSVCEVTSRLVLEMDKDEHDLYICNFANPDMLGHTGNLKAAIKSLETVDKNIKKIYKKIVEKDITLFICADHGNCELMYNENVKLPHTAHTTNLVPFCLVNYDENVEIKDGGALCDIAPTILEVMGLEKPKEMTGKSLIIRK